MVYEAAAPKAQSGARLLSRDVLWEYTDGYLNSNIIWTVFLLFSEMKDWAYLYINSLLIQDLPTFLCGYDVCDYRTHILTFILEMRTVILHRFLTVIFLMSDSDALPDNIVLPFIFILLVFQNNVCSSNSTITFSFYYRPTCLFFHTVL